MSKIRNLALHLCLSVIILSVVCNSATIQSLNEKCLCDITSDQCDNQCCCDSQCSDSFKTKWNTFNLCNDDSLTIPFCSEIVGSDDVNVLDMHSGLRTLYTVVKRLFCITSTNFVDSAQWYQTSVGDTDLTVEVEELTTAHSKTSLNSDLNILSNVSISGLPLAMGSGICKSSTYLTENMDLSENCRVYVSSSTDVDSSLLSISTIETSLSTTLNKFTTADISTSSAASQSLSTSCAGTACSNVIKQLQIYINSENGTINSNSYVVVGPVEVDQAGYISISYQYTFVSTDSTGETVLPYGGNVGYGWGDDLVLMFSDTSASTYHKINNPINLAFRKTDGTCRTATTDDAGDSFVELKFGVNQIYSCAGNSNLIYTNLIQIFNYLGRYGTASGILADYVALTVPSTAITISESVQMVIHYAGIGSDTNRQNEILRVELKAVTSKDSLSTLYVEYVDVSNEYTLYVPPAPTVDAYLPNDFLYPFYVA